MEIPEEGKPAPESHGEARKPEASAVPDIGRKLDAILLALGVDPQTLEEEKR